MWLITIKLRPSARRQEACVVTAARPRAATSERPKGQTETKPCIGAANVELRAQSAIHLNSAVKELRKVVRQDLPNTCHESRKLSAVREVWLARPAPRQAKARTSSVSRAADGLTAVRRQLQSNNCKVEAGQGISTTTPPFFNATTFRSEFQNGCPKQQRLGRVNDRGPQGRKQRSHDLISWASSTTP